MTTRRSLVDLMHNATHRVPGVPEHRDQPGHSRPGPAHSHSPADRLHHRPANQGEPRVLVAWQRRIAAFVGRSGR